ncbi:hypothetical protein XM47_00450 [Catenovulum maritimum]|uniref:HTH araC/xylS-type domain-containing protein n=2 Tax=Catenovulum maritimum TaxID=1513271 RepID=A0A0J8H0V2_9ALTE|nr:hypothetical protein XM47_00450 [Catenovulum maritimum]
MVMGKPQYKGLVMLLALHSLEFINIIEELNITRQYWLVTPAMQVALGPLYYLLVKNMIYRDFRVKAHLIHLMPAVIAIAFTPWWPQVLAIAYISLAIYLVMSFRLLWRYRVYLKETTVDYDGYALGWLFNTLTVVSVIEIVDFTRLNLQLVLDIEVLVHWYFISTFIALSLTSYLIINAIRQPELYNSFEDMESISLKKEKLEQADKEHQQAKVIFADIENYLTNSQSFLQAKYSLRDLSQSLGLSEQLVSWTINKGGDINFSDYINGKRINVVKAKLQEQKQAANILAIAFDAGFSSKSTFNAVFKKQTNLTPSEYIKSLNNN